MGLDFSYMLYFKKDRLWDALDAVSAMARPHQPPTLVRFPDHELSIPLATWSSNHGVLQSDAPELDFSTVLYFEEDEAILEYLLALGDEASDRSPPDSFEPKRIPIGYIYLTIYTDLSARHPEGNPSNLVLFNFGTTGTRMSLLFDESTSIRKAFIRLLERVPGVCGVFNREMDGVLFWINGRKVSEEIGDPYMLPEEIE